jgi:hypothetical protein
VQYNYVMLTNRIHTVERSYFIIYAAIAERAYFIIYAGIVERSYFLIYAAIAERSYLIIYAGISGDVIDYRRYTYIRLNTNYFRQWMGGGVTY